MGLANASTGAVISAALRPERRACILGVAGVAVAASTYALERSTARVVRHGEGGPIRIAIPVELRGAGLVHRERRVAKRPRLAHAPVRPAVELRPLRRRDQAGLREGSPGSAAPRGAEREHGGEHGNHRRPHRA